MESRYLLNLSVQNALDCISQNFSFKNFPWGACSRRPLERRARGAPDGHYRAHILQLYYHKILRPPLVTKSHNHTISVLSWQGFSQFGFKSKRSILENFQKSRMFLSASKHHAMSVDV